MNCNIEIWTAQQDNSLITRDPKGLRRKKADTLDLSSCGLTSATLCAVRESHIFMLFICCIFGIVRQYTIKMWAVTMHFFMNKKQDRKCFSLLDEKLVWFTKILFIFIFRLNLDEAIVALSQKILSMPCPDSVRAYIFLEILTMPSSVSNCVCDFLKK